LELDVMERRSRFSNASRRARLDLGATQSSAREIVDWLVEIRLRRNEIAAKLLKLESEDCALIAQLERASRQRSLAST